MNSDKSKILSDLKELEVEVTHPDIASLPASTLQMILTATKRLVVLSAHWTNPQEAHEMQSKEGMRVCAFCRAPLEA